MDLNIKTDNNYFARKIIPFNQSKNTQIRINTKYNSNCNNLTQDKQLVFGINLLKIFQKSTSVATPVCQKSARTSSVRALSNNIFVKLSAVVENCTKKIEKRDFGNSYYGRNDTYIERAKAYAGLGNFDAALRDCCYVITGQKSDVAVQEYISHFDPSNQERTIYEVCFEKILEAKNLTSQIVQKSENVGDLYAQRASAYLDLDLRDNAIFDLKSAAILHKISHSNKKQLSNVYSRIGFRYLIDHNIPEALKYFKMAQKTDCTNLQATNLFNALIKGYKFN